MTQDLFSWPGDVNSLITEMKRRACVRTDQELANFLGKAQSMVANWRKRGSVPDASLLSFEHALKREAEVSTGRLLAARILAFKLPEMLYRRYQERHGFDGRQFAYSVIAMYFSDIVEEIGRRLQVLESTTETDSKILVDELLESSPFCNELLDWISDRPALDLLLREKASVIDQAAFLARRLGGLREATNV